MPPCNRRTVIIKTGNFPSSLSAAEMVESITSHLQVSRVEAVQLMPGRQARITFKNIKAKTMYEALGEMTIKDVVCPVYIPRYTSQVMVYLYPFEGDNQRVVKALSPFGTVQDVRHQEWSNVEGVAMGTQLVKIIRQHHIPQFVFIDGFKCKVWYKDQPLECDICHQGHKANVCPLKGKCPRCHQAGHFVAECPNPAWNHDDPAPAAASADASASAAPSLSGPGDTSFVVDPPSSIIIPENRVDGASVCCTSFF